MATYTTFSEPFLRSLPTLEIKILRLRILFRVKKLTLTTIRSMLTNMHRWIIHDWSIWFTVYYGPTAVTPSLCITAAIAYSEGIIIFVLEISNAFQHTILPYPEKVDLISIYLDCYKMKWPKNPLVLINQKGFYIQEIRSIQGKKPAGKFCLDWLKSISITFKMIRSSSDHAILSWIYKTYKYFLAI